MPPPSADTRDPGGGRRRRRLALRLSAILGIAVLGWCTVLAPQVSDERHWRPVFREEFNTPAALGSFASVYGARWFPYPDGWRSTTGVGTYQPSRTVSVSDGVLDIWVRKTGAGYSSAAVMPRIQGYGQTYGRYSVRFRADPVPGYKVAFLLWPDSERWPDDGEIDFPEGELTGTIGAFAHHASPDGGQDEFPTAARFDSWHVATIEWTPGSVRFLLDGDVVGESREQVPTKSMHWVLQTEVANEQPPPDGAAGHIQVDWAQMWAYDP